MKPDDSVNVSRVTNTPNKIQRKRPVSVSKDDDTDWILETPKRPARPSRIVEVKKEEPL